MWGRDSPSGGEGNAGCPMCTAPPGQNIGVGAMPPAPSCAACTLRRTGSPFTAASDSTTPAVCSPGGAVFTVGVWAERAGWMYKVERLKSWGLLHSCVSKWKSTQEWTSLGITLSIVQLKIFRTGI